MGRIYLLKFAVGALAAFGVLASADAGPAQHLPFSDIDTLIVPESSPLAVRSTDKKEVSVQISGRYVLSGTYHLGYLGWEGEQPGDWTAYIDPDAADRAKLPYWQRRGGNEHVWIDNQRQFARAVIPADVLTRLQTEKIKSVSGRISIVVEGYKAWIECDAPNYSTHFVSIYKPQLVQLSQAYTGFGC